MKRSLPIRLAAALLLTLSSILSIAMPVAHATALTCTWTGGGSDGNFNTAANWSGCNSAAPVNGSNLVFDTSSLNSQPTSLNNNIANLSVGSITFQGSSVYFYALNGNSITVTGGVTDTSHAGAQIGTVLNISGAQTFAINAGDVTAFSGGLAGSGNVTVTGSGQTDVDDLSNYTGTISTTSSSIALINAGSSTYTSAGTVVVSGTGSLSLENSGGRDAHVNYNLPLSIGGTGPNPTSGVTALSLTGYTGTVTLAGATTLTSDVQVSGAGTLIVTGPLSGNFALSAISGSPITIQNNSSNNTSKTPGGSQQSSLQVTSIASGDNQPSTLVTVGSNQEYDIDGVRGATTVDGKGILKGNGTVGDLTLYQDSIVAPGHSPGCLTSTGNLKEGGTYQAEIGGTTACTEYDQLIVNGTVTLNGGTTPPSQGILQVSLVNGFKPKAGQTFTIINNKGTGAVNDTFAGQAEGSTFTVDGNVFKISYKGGDGNDVVLTVITAATPDTGLAEVTAHPLYALVTSVAAAGILYGTSRRLARR